MVRLVGGGRGAAEEVVGGYRWMWIPYMGVAHKLLGAYGGMHPPKPSNFEPSESSFETVSGPSSHGVTDYWLISISCLGENDPLYVRDNCSMV